MGSISGFNEGLRDAGSSFNGIMDVIREVQLGIMQGWFDFKEGLSFIFNGFSA